MKFAQLEYKEGSQERGRTMFEGILSSYPKRIDVWNVYIDLEIQVGSNQGARLEEFLLNSVYHAVIDLSR